jgi:hypothetical protein
MAQRLLVANANVKSPTGVILDIDTIHPSLLCFIIGSPDETMFVAVV